MEYFIVGDIHGCYHTFRQMLEYWHRGGEVLVSVGDLIDRGHYSSRVVQLCMQLAQDQADTIFIKGNHELEFTEHIRSGYNRNWLEQCGQKTLDDFAASGMDLNTVAAWMQQMPLKLETDALLVTHAGLSATARPYDEDNIDGVCWNRQPLQAIGKLQVHGHTPLKGRQALFTPESQSWNIDTAAVYGYGLTGLKVNATGIVTGQIYIDTDPRDVR